jgi:DNA invertase Pin-like site-specific DNA recombinase
VERAIEVRIAHANLAPRVSHWALASFDQPPEQAADRITSTPLGLEVSTRRRPTGRILRSKPARSDSARPSPRSPRRTATRWSIRLSANVERGERVGADKDSFYDAAVSGADPVGERPGFKAMMDRIAGNGVRVIIVESPDRFARDLAVQIAGHDYLKGLGVALVPTSAPDFFAEGTPTAVLVRQVLGAIAQFEKASLVAKMKAARDRKRATGYKVGGRKRYDEDRPEVVALAHKLARRRRKGWPLSLRQISAALADAGQVNSNGAPYAAATVQRMLQQRPRRAVENPQMD